MLFPAKVRRSLASVISRNDETGSSLYKQDSDVHVLKLCKFCYLWNIDIFVLGQA